MAPVEFLNLKFLKISNKQKKKKKQERKKLFIHRTVTSFPPLFFLEGFSFFSLPFKMSYYGFGWDDYDYDLDPGNTIFPATPLHILIGTLLGESKTPMLNLGL